MDKNRTVRPDDTPRPGEASRLAEAEAVRVTSIMLVRGAVLLWAGRALDAASLGLSEVVDGLERPVAIDAVSTSPGDGGDVLHRIALSPDEAFRPDAELVLRYRGRDLRRLGGDGRRPGASAIIEGVDDYRLTGRLGGIGPDGAAGLTLMIDGVPAGPLRSVPAGTGAADTTVTFSQPLPAAVFDGLAHELGVASDGIVVARTTWRFDPQYRLEQVDLGRASFTVFEASAADRPVTVVASDGETSLRRQTVADANLETETGRRFGRIDLDLGRFAAGRTISIRLGADGTLPFLRIAPGPAARRLALMRRVNRVIRTSGDEDAASGPAMAETTGRLRAEYAADPLMADVTVLPADGDARPISVVVPVHSGRDALALCLSSLHAALAAGDCLGEIIVVDDASPDPAISAMLERFAGEVDSVRLIVNPHNLGFVGSVNVGIAAADPMNDVLLLNADAALPPGAGRRLRAALTSSPEVASVTPLSNNGSLVSLPEANAATAMDVTRANAVDAFCRDAFAGRRLELPVGVGFCMLVRRSALDLVGGFGAEWGKGYCEEVDWCRRASDLGFSHLCALDVFVLHEGSVSFGTEERLRLLETNHALLERRYPEYLSEIRTFLARDPLEEVRIEAAIAAFLPFRRIVLCLAHRLGGGTARFAEEMAAGASAAGIGWLDLSIARDPWLGSDRLSCRMPDGAVLTLSADGARRLFEALKRRFPDVSALVGSLLQLDRRVIHALFEAGIPYSVVLHDFQWYCPRVNLIDETGEYCGEPAEVVCQDCVRKREIFDFGAENAAIHLDIGRWRAANARLLRAARRLVAPSEDTARRYRKAFPDITVSVLPHPAADLVAEIACGGDGGTIRIAVVGTVTLAKGLNFLLDLAREINWRAIPAQIHVFGELGDPTAAADIPNLTVHGPYQPADLAGLLASTAPDFVLFPGGWPETYSYVLSEIWALGYAAIARDVGAIAERIRASEAGFVIDPDLTPADLAASLPAVRDAVLGLVGHRFRPAPPFSPTAYLAAALGSS